MTLSIRLRRLLLLSLLSLTLGAAMVVVWSVGTGPALAPALVALAALGAEPTASLTNERPAAYRWLTLPFAEASALIEASADLFCLALGPTQLTVGLRKPHPPLPFFNHELIREGLLGAGFARHSEVSP